MYIDHVRTSSLTLTEDALIYDDGVEKEVHFHIAENVKVHYLSVPRSSGENTRVFHIASGATFIGAGVYMHADMVQKMSVIIDGKNVHADMKLLTLLRNNAKVSIDGIGRVEKGSEKVFLRVDQTNILLGENISVRGRPVLEIETDSIEGGHSNRTHRISGEALFYLQSHGIDASTAEGMLLSADIERHVGVLGEKSEGIGESIREVIFA